MYIAILYVLIQDSHAPHDFGDYILGKIQNYFKSKYIVNLNDSKRNI